MGNKLTKRPRLWNESKDGIENQNMAALRVLEKNADKVPMLDMVKALQAQVDRMYKQGQTEASVRAYAAEELNLLAEKARVMNASMASNFVDAAAGVATEYFNKPSGSEAISQRNLEHAELRLKLKGFTTDELKDAAGKYTAANGKNTLNEDELRYALAELRERGEHKAADMLRVSMKATHFDEPWKRDAKYQSASMHADFYRSLGAGEIGFLPKDAPSVAAGVRVKLAEVLNLQPRPKAEYNY